MGSRDCNDSNLVANPGAVRIESSQPVAAARIRGLAVEVARSSRPVRARTSIAGGLVASGAVVRVTGGGASCCGASTPPAKLAVRTREAVIGTCMSGECIQPLWTWRSPNQLFVAGKPSNCSVSVRDSIRPPADRDRLPVTPPKSPITWSSAWSSPHDISTFRPPPPRCRFSIQDSITVSIPALIGRSAESSTRR